MPARSKLTPEVQARIVQAIAGGSHLETAARYGGVDGSTFWRWMAEGREAPHGTKRAFYEAVKRVEVEAEVRMVSVWQRHGIGTPENPGDWRALRDLLARRHPERWMPREAKEVSGPGGAPIAVAVDARMNLLAKLDQMQERLAPIVAGELLSENGEG